MRHFSTVAHRIATIAVLVIVAVLGACSNSSVTPVPRNALPSQRATSTGYNLVRVDYSASTNTQLTGINDSGEIVGNYNSSYPSTSGWNSFTSQSGYTSFQSAQFPYGNADSQYLYAISSDSNPIEVGYVSDPNSETGYWGVVRSQGIWSITRRVGNAEIQGCGNPNWKHALLGFDTVSHIAVGYYTDATVGSVICPLKPYEVEPGNNNDTEPFKLVPSGWSNTQATGIVSNSGKEDIVGSTTLSGGAQAGWFLSSKTTSASAPTSFRCCDTGHFDTIANGITLTAGTQQHELIVGTYKSGSNWDGFVYDKTATGTQWTTIVAFGSNHTVVTGINASKTICGWYLDSGRARGFVGTFSGMRPGRRHRTATASLEAR